MQVYVLISATAQPGKYSEARKAVVETVKYLSANQSYVGAYEAVRPQQGPNSVVSWLCRFASLADYEKDSELRGKDPEWSKVFKQVNETVDADNISAQILQVLE